MPIAVGVTQISDVRLGTTPVDKVYLGTTLVWQRVPPYQMTKTNTTAGSGTSYATLTGMVADAAYPGSIVDSGAALRVPDGITAYNAVVRAEVPHTGGTAPRYGQTRIYRNGSLVATGAQESNSPGTSFAEWSGSVQAGDYFVISWRGEGNFFNRPTAQAGAFLRITPVL